MYNVTHMIPVSKPYMGVKEILNVVSTILSGNLSSGRNVEELEKVFAKTHHAKHACAVSNGTAALYMALLALGVGVGDEVITTPFSFVATANAILMVGAIPVFVDIEPNTYLLDPDKISEKVTKKTKAVICVSLYGLACDVAKIRKVVGKQIFIIEDAAQSVGSSRAGHFSGSLADISTFSLYATKNITSGEGGVILTQSQSLAEKLFLLRQHGIDMKRKYNYKCLGYNFRMSDISASIGVAQMTRLKFISEKRRKIASRYTKELGSLTQLSVFETPPDAYCTYHQYPIKLNEGSHCQRDKLADKLREKGVATAVYYPKTLYKVPHISSVTISAECPIAERTTEQALCLPIFPSLAEDDQWYIIDSIYQILR
jgi:perosamine synthetase